MNLQRNCARIATIGLLAFALAGCATHDRKSNNTLLGAGLGAATGAVFSGGDPLYTVGGAAAGGLLGNILTEDRSYRRSNNWDRNDRRRSSHKRNRHDRRYR